MAKAPRVKNPNATVRAKAAPRPHLPDPKKPIGPYRPFTDPGLSEAWWWLGIPVAVAVFVVVSHSIAPEWHVRWVTQESGILETAQFILMVMGLALAVQLLFDPFVRKRPLVLAVTALAALSCLFIGGEEVSWGQHIFYWQDPELVTAVNNEGELSLHNINKGFERGPRTVLELGVLGGGLLLPLLCAYAPRLRQSRLALFLPSAVLVPTALLALFFKLFATLKFEGLPGVAGRPSEAVEFYLYFFILAYLVVFERRIRELETEDAGTRRKA
jgi:hypothetical protein